MQNNSLYAGSDVTHTAFAGFPVEKTTIWG